MRVLLDECLPARLKRMLMGHSVQTVTEIGWRSAKDGPLLHFAEGRFDVFLTVDSNLEKQNDLTALNVGFVIAYVPNNRLESFEPIAAELRDAIDRSAPGEVFGVISPFAKRGRAAG